jgi:hypothetical protein
MDIFKVNMTLVDLDQPFSIWWILRSPPWLGWPLWNICVTSDHEYVSLVVSTSRSFPHSWFITGFITRLARRMSLVEQELLTLPDHLSSPPVFSGVRVTRCLCVCFVDRCLSFCTFSFGHCVVCSSIRGHLWHRYSITVNQVMVATVRFIRWKMVDPNPRRSCSPWLYPSWKAIEYLADKLGMTNWSSWCDKDICSCDF